MAQQLILKLSKEETKATLALVVLSVGMECTPVSYRRLGLNSVDGALWYIIQCKENAYTVNINRDKGGTGTVLSCPMLKFVAKVDCDALSPSEHINPFPLPN